MSPNVKLSLKVLLPLLVLAAGAAAAMGFAAMQEPPAEVDTAAPLPVVRVQTVSLDDHRFVIRSQGTVRPRTESRLVPEVSGNVVWVSPNLVSGGFFEADEPLLRIDARDYEQAVVGADAEVAAAKLRLAQEQAEAEIAREEWTDLGEGPPPDLTARVPQLAQARAAVAAAEANLVTSRRNLERTEIRAPYAGRVREETVDLGQFVTAGGPLGTIYAIDYVEIRLPLPDEDLAYIDDLPLLYRGQTAGGGPRVVLRADFAGKTHEWEGRIVRTEGEIDPVTRMVNAVARVQDPYGRGEDPERPPLAVGMFVQAEIEGSVAEQCARLPRAALRGADGAATAGGTSSALGTGSDVGAGGGGAGSDESDRGSRGRDSVWVLDAENRLTRRTITPLRMEGDEVLVSEGLAEGDRVVVSTLDVESEGMRVDVYEGGGS